MKRKLTALLLALVMMLALLPVTALAADPPTTIKPPTNLEVGYYMWPSIIEDKISIQDDLYSLLQQGKQARGYTMTVDAQVDFKIDDGSWHYSADWDAPGASGTFRKYMLDYYNDFNDEKVAAGAGKIGEKRLYIHDRFPEEKDNVPKDPAWLKTHSITTRARLVVVFNSDRDHPVFSDWSNELIMTETSDAWSNASDWALPELQKAQAENLIPDSLNGGDLTKPITRAEFAGVAVKVYENLSGTTVSPAASNPFTDTKDTDVLKALSINVMVGTAADKFSPSVILNRETAATALTRVLKRAYIPGWTYATDSQYTLNFTMPPKFADDAQISDWAKSSVYFMAANEVIKGTGNNKFSPKATTAAETAVGYANATREQALVIAVRMVDNLKGKTPDYTQGGGTTDTPSGDTSLVGQWSSEYDVPIEKSNEWIEFKNDGTFHFYYYLSPSYWSAIQGELVTDPTRGGTLEIKGNYAIKDDKINCTNLLYSWKAAFGSDNNYTDKPVNDNAWSFYLSNDPPKGYSNNGRAWLYINIYMDQDHSIDTSEYFSFQKPE